MPPSARRKGECRGEPRQSEMDARTCQILIGAKPAQHRLERPARIGKANAIAGDSGSRTACCFVLKLSGAAVGIGCRAVGRLRFLRPSQSETPVGNLFQDRSALSRIDVK